MFLTLKNKLLITWSVFTSVVVKEIRILVFEMTLKYVFISIIISLVLYSLRISHSWSDR